MTDLLFVLALALIAVGAGLIYMPAGLIVAGALLAVVLFFGRLGAERTARTTE